jgi:hypothetical protein
MAASAAGWTELNGHVVKTEGTAAAASARVGRTRVAETA